MKFTRTARDSAQPQDMQAATQSQNKRSRVVAIGAAVAIAAGVLFAAAPAQAIGVPKVTLKMWSAKHHANSYGEVQHYNTMKNGSLERANWAPPGKVSQNSCWVNASDHYFYNFRS